MDYLRTLGKNVYIALVPTLFQVVVCSLTGYAFARYNFPLKKLWFGILILTFVMPSQITMVPNFYLMLQAGFIGSIKAFIVPAALGQGFKSAIFILIFYNFHRQIPKSLIEASEIDGAGQVYSFIKIAMPLSIPAIVTVFLFSFVWYWNETYLVNLYLGYKNSRANGGLTTLLLELSRLWKSWQELSSLSLSAAGDSSVDVLNESVRMAGTMLAVAPLLGLYFILQRQFVQSIDNTGITGE
jgi:multiple sugar transport system permease protein